MSTKADIVVIGAGFYGARIALTLNKLGVKRIIMLEREDGLMRRASFANQARIHNGYHYPRSIATAIAARQNFLRFVEEFAYAVNDTTKMLYAIARDSRVSAEQFSRFCTTIGAKCETARTDHEKLFEVNTIEAVFSVDELSFDSVAIAQALARDLNRAGIVCLFSVAAHVISCDEQKVAVAIPGETIEASYVLNCTYASLDAVGVSTKHVLKRELAELALIRPPLLLSGLAVTVMDGPFFSTMPFPSLGAYTLSHVRYTPHATMSGSDRVEPATSSHFELMVRDAERFMPCIGTAVYLGSLFEEKAILEATEGTDARPILFEVSDRSDRIISVLGAKIDNIYDVEDLLIHREWAL